MKKNKNIYIFLTVLITGALFITTAFALNADFAKPAEDSERAAVSYGMMSDSALADLLGISMDELKRKVAAKGDDIYALIKAAGKLEEYEQLLLDIAGIE